MPTTRVRRRRFRTTELTPGQLAWLRDDPEPPASGDIEDWNLFHWLTSRSPTERHFGLPSAVELWERHGARFLEEWIAEEPGTRPTPWWVAAAPRLPLGTYPDAWFDGELPLPRQRIGGVGTPIYEALRAVKPAFWHGIPTGWIDRSLLAVYPHMGRFRVPAVDPANPPIFEAEATYLERHELLLPGERRRLRDDDFRPVRLDEIIDLRLDEAK